MDLLGHASVLFLLAYILILVQNNTPIPLSLTFIIVSFGHWPAATYWYRRDPESISMIYFITNLVVSPTIALICIFFFFCFLWKVKLNWKIKLCGIVPCGILAQFHFKHIPESLDFIYSYVKSLI